MAVNKAVHKLHAEIQKIHKAEKHEKTVAAQEKKALATEKSALAKLQAQEQALLDQFSSGSPPPDVSKQLLGIGQKEQQAMQAYDKALAKGDAAIAKDKRTIKAAQKAGLKDLKAAKHLSKSQIKKYRQELGVSGHKKASTQHGGKGGGGGAVSTHTATGSSNTPSPSQSGTTPAPAQTSTPKPAGLDAGASAMFDNLGQQESSLMGQLNQALTQTPDENGMITINGQKVNASAYMQKLQFQMNIVQEMMQTLSNTLKTQHDGRMNTIANIRG